jgi:hypothetical protein
VKPKYPGEIAAASDHVVQVNEDCRRQARAQHLHLLKRYRFMRDCKRQMPSTEIDHFVMAITSAEATFWHYHLPTDGSTVAVLSERVVGRNGRGK